MVRGRRRIAILRRPFPATRGRGRNRAALQRAAHPAKWISVPRDFRGGGGSSPRCPLANRPSNDHFARETRQPSRFRDTVPSSASSLPRGRPGIFAPLRSAFPSGLRRSGASAASERGTTPLLSRGPPASIVASFRSPCHSPFPFTFLHHHD